MECAGRQVSEAIGWGKSLWHTNSFQEERIVEEIVLDERDSLAGLFPGALYHDIPGSLKKHIMRTGTESLSVV